MLFTVFGIGKSVGPAIRTYNISYGIYGLFFDLAQEANDFSRWKPGRAGRRWCSVHQASSFSLSIDLYMCRSIYYHYHRMYNVLEERGEINFDRSTKRQMFVSAYILPFLF